MERIKHTFNIMSVQTASKDGKKYLGRNGTQAYRVSTKIGEDWYSAMIWEEDLVPKKGQTYEIELSENDGFKNWNYATLTKKEQIQQQVVPEGGPEGFKEEPFIIEPREEVNKAGRGASYNLAFQYVLQSSNITDINAFLNKVEEIANIIVPRQEKFTNKL